MATLVTAKTAATISQLIVKVRRLIGDGSTVAGNQRWANSDIQDAIDSMLAQMWTELYGEDPSGFLRTVTMTYTAELDMVVIPTGVEGQSIIRVEDYDNPSLPVYLDYRDHVDTDRFGDQFGWSLFGGSIAVRPIPTAAKTLRIFLIANFPAISGSSSISTDQHAFSVNHEELVTLGAAIRLQEIDEEISKSRLLRYQQLYDQFTRTASRIRGPLYVRSSRLLLG